MKKLVIVLSVTLILSACVNTGKIVSGKLIINKTEKDLSGKEIVLNDDCSPKSVKMNMQAHLSVNVLILQILVKTQA